jgi:four helix bundle protein
MHNFRELSVRQKARELNKKVYSLCDTFPDKERFSLCNQMQRASTSIASNIAEGAGRNSPKEFVQFLHIAYWSAFELETQIILSCDLWYITDKWMKPIMEHLQEIERMIYWLIQHNKKTKK